MLDTQINKLLQNMDSSVPIAPFEGNSYLVGDKLRFLQIRGESVLIRIGGGWETLKGYIQKNTKPIERTMAISMIKND